MAADRPAFESDAAALAGLTATLNEEGTRVATSLYEHGYAVVDLPFDPDDIIAAGNYTRGAIRSGERIQDGWLENDAVRHLATHPALLDLLSRLYGRRAFPFQTLNFAMGSEQRTHSDTFHFNSVPERFMCGVWIALEDITEESGPLEYYPGSHRLNVLSNADLSSTDDYCDYVAALLEGEGMKPERALMKAGQAFIWSANLFHGGSPRRSKTATRLSQVTHYYFDDCAYYTPLASQPETDTYWIREPYDIAARRFVGSNRDLLPGNAKLHLRLMQRLRVLARRAHRPGPMA